MDTSTLILVDIVLNQRSLRGAARLSGRPVSSISAALARCESALSTSFCQRAGLDLAFTLEANRLAPLIAEAAQLACGLYAAEANPFASTVRLQALGRFVEVAERGSIRQAARALMLGQPQLSRQLAHLETALGHKLLKRGTGGTVLTETGLRLREDCGRLLQLWGRYREPPRTDFVAPRLPSGWARSCRLDMKARSPGNWQS